MNSPNYGEAYTLVHCFVKSFINIICHFISLTQDSTIPTSSTYLIKIYPFFIKWYTLERLLSGICEKKYVTEPKIDDNICHHLNQFHKPAFLPNLGVVKFVFTQIRKKHSYKSIYFFSTSAALNSFIICCLLFSRSSADIASS